ncbi:hypothetical protein TNCV_150721 [Trichonephila clavipes]|nr:hypothetical protein TNCV_150721 [Trichonephila clavipes]
MECKYSPGILLNTFKLCFHNDTLRKAKTCLQKRRGHTHVSCFVIGCTTITGRLNAAISKETAMMVSVQTVLTTPYVVELSVWLLVLHSSIPDSRYGMWFYNPVRPIWQQNCFLGVNGRRSLGFF